MQYMVLPINFFGNYLFFAIFMIIISQNAKHAEIIYRLSLFIPAEKFLNCQT